MTVTAIRLRGLGKSYGPTRALTDVSLDIEAGTVHAVLGENGAGKSTLIKILTGVLAPDTGTVDLFDERLDHDGPQSGEKLGLATVFQELSLVPHLSVEDNLFLSNPPRSKFGWIDLGRQRSESRHWLELVGLGEIHPGTHVNQLSLTQKQLLEIAKGFAKKPRILLLDEATASLPGNDVDRLFNIIAEARRKGLTVIYISHRMTEIERIADRCSVLRNGQLIETFDAHARSHDEICRMLAGREISQVFPPRRPVPADAPIVLDVSELSAVDKVHNISFTLRQGEVLGIGGLEGQGQKELLLALYGAIRATSGSVTLDGRPFKPSGPASAIAGQRPVMLLPEDRKTDGLLLAESIRDNMLLSVTGKLSRYGLRDKAAETACSRSIIQKLSIKISSADAPVSSLSGGNQQKVLLARLLLNEPAVYILMDPTRGIDVGTKQEIYALIRELADRGAAVLFLTTDFEELIGMCDRVLVLYAGRISRDLKGDAINEVNILEASLDVKRPVTDLNRMDREIRP
jgi:ribose transport system ATP-binding protein